MYLSGFDATQADEDIVLSSLKSNAQDHTDAYEVTSPLNVTLILERIYLDGEVSEEIKEVSIQSMEDFWAEYSSWQLIDQDEEQMVFQKNIDDISPLLKANGYFGITENGVLTIFNGKPATDKVIQSFFQIDVKKLESHQHEELRKGIPIQSKDKYVEVLEVFKPFSVTSQKN
ncbi:intercompartmental signaling factor BofC [Bacillus sp. RD4P76]|uniref:Intercompartmental signaling factor BofC n=2 Tax=Bacillus suaedaesalsae TaxID=2810349 RepID=A0ABS2DMT8_9BACI|nr:intercompartmental signaling factor BofC [Bacillus suaedaesalsae]